MAIFLESPWPILAIGIVIEAVLAMMLLRTGQGRILWAILGVAPVVALGVLIEWAVVTDGEAIADTLYACAAAVEANDIEGLLEHISPSAEKTRADARLVLSQFEMRMARIRGLEIAVDRAAKPPTAKAEFVAFGKGRSRTETLPYDHDTRRVIVNLRREGDRWLVVDYHLTGERY
jgi:hypothetical protein